MTSSKLNTVGAVKIQGEANPFDPDWELYFEERLANQMRSSLTGRRKASYLWARQLGKCLVCEQGLKLEEGWHVHHLVKKAHGGSNLLDNLVMLHANCH